ncbi:hypothetical protein RFF05_18325 [Bengtsoniella intestinalis]|uniref:hypothetical protein n=1 Tax=Bengtsoniella intestinalis TaxID=3073143 RepID=UPI00391F4E93
MAKGRNPEIFRFISLSATALTVCAFHQQNTNWVMKEDWSALMDCTGISTALWVLVVASIVINGVTLFAERKKP